MPGSPGSSGSPGVRGLRVARVCRAAGGRAGSWGRRSSGVSGVAQGAAGAAGGRAGVFGVAGCSGVSGWPGCARRRRGACPGVFGVAGVLGSPGGQGVPAPPGGVPGFFGVAGCSGVSGWPGCAGAAGERADGRTVGGGLGSGNAPSSGSGAAAAGDSGVPVHQGPARQLDLRPDLRKATTSRWATRPKADGQHPHELDLAVRQIVAKPWSEGLQGRCGAHDLGWRQEASSHRELPPGHNPSRSSEDAKGRVVAYLGAAKQGLDYIDKVLDNVTRFGRSQRRALSGPQ